MRGVVSALFILCSVSVVAASELQKTSAVQEKLLNLAAPQSSPDSDAGTCVLQSIACGQTIHGTLDPGDCVLSDGSAVDFFQFNGSVGQAVDATLTSSAFPPFMVLLNPTPSSVASAAGATSAHISFTLNSGGKWTWAVNNNNHFFQSGAYTLAFTCPGTSGSCTPDDNTLCLSNGRFRVTAHFDTGHGSSGAAHVVSLTSDTGYLWFFASSNVEAVVKVLNACALGGHYWVFAGGLTNVNVVMTVTDTQTGAMKTYTNPPNTTFQPIQDTSAFSTCP